jgi:hypothetical protein
MTAKADGLRRGSRFPGQQVPADERLPSPPNLKPWLKPLWEKYGKRAEDQ